MCYHIPEIKPFLAAPIFLVHALYYMTYCRCYSRFAIPVLTNTQTRKLDTSLVYFKRILQQ